MYKKIVFTVLVFLFCSVVVLSEDSMEKKVSDEAYKLSKKKQEEVYEKQQDIIVAPPPPPLMTFDLPPISFATADDEPHFVKMTLTLGYEKNNALAGELGEKKDRIGHVINILAKGKHFQDINSTEGIINFSGEIKAHVNALLISGKIKEVYFREFIIN